MTFSTLLTLYSIYLVFVIFCFQEINTKIKDASERFRDWCSNREKEKILVEILKDGNLAREKLTIREILGVNWEFNAWLEKDVIFHIKDLQIRIKNSTARIVENDNDPIKLWKRYEKGCNDYYNYFYACYKYKNVSKLIVMVLFLILMVISIGAPGLKVDLLTSYLFIFILIAVVIAMLIGPSFNFVNNPLRNRFFSLSKSDQRDVEDLEKLVKEI